MSKKIRVIIPAYNEELSIAKVINDIPDNSKIMGYPATNLRKFLKEKKSVLLRKMRQNKRFLFDMQDDG